MLGRSGSALAAAPVALMVVLVACASSDAESGATGTSAPPAGSASAAPGEEGSADDDAAGPSEGDTIEVAVSVRDGTVRPKPRRVAVPVGATVRLVVTSDVDDEVHVHDYDAEGVLEAGRPTTIEFVADQPGLFEIETHESELELVQLEVR